MTKLFRWLFGYVEFAFTGGFIDGFVNECYQQKINIHNIKREANSVSATCLAREYKRLHSVARKHGGIVKIIKKKGALFPFLKIKNRLGLIAGAVAFLLIFNTLSGYVWSIDFDAESGINTREIESFLSQNGFSVGTRWRGANLSSLENLALATYDDVAWLHINRYGSKAVVEIDKAIVPNEIDDEGGKYNLKATKDGVVTYTNVKRGWDIVKVGSAVTKGDLLASGIYESELNKTNHFTHASGVVIAKVKEPISLTINRKQSKKVYTNEKQKKALIFFGLRLPLYIGKTALPSCEIDRKCSYIKLNDVDLPIGIETINCKEFVVLDDILNDKQLKDLATLEVDKKIKSKLTDCEILKKNIKMKAKKDCVVVSGEVVALENIAEEVKLVASY